MADDDDDGQYEFRAVTTSELKMGKKGDDDHFML